MEKPDFEEAAKTYTNDGTWGYPIEGDAPGEMMFNEIKKAYKDGADYVWSSHVEPLQKENEELLKLNKYQAERWREIDQENKALKEQLKTLEQQYRDKPV